MTLASWITAIRFILAPLIFWQLAAGTAEGIVWGLALLLLAGATDVVDGWVARARNEVSEVGKMLDPLADKIGIFTVLLALSFGWGLPFWLVYLYVIKESLQVLAGAFLLKRCRQLIPANGWGKSSTVGFFLGFGVYFLQRQLGMAIIGIAIILSIYALYTYYREYQQLTK